MKRTFILALILLCTFVYTDAKTKKTKNKTKKEAIRFDPPVISEDYIEEDTQEPYLSDEEKQIVYIKQLMSETSNEEEYIKKLEESGVRITQSPDNKLRIFSWLTDNIKDSTDFYLHLAQYYIAPNKTRWAYPEDNYYRATGNTFLDYIGISIYSVFFNSIQHFIDDIYLVRATTENNAHVLFALDISRGILKDAYIFNDANGNPINIISVELPYTGDINKTYILNNNHLQVTKIDSTGIVKDDSYFNGAHFANTQDYQDQLMELDTIPTGEATISRLYYKDANNLQTISSLFPGDAFSLVADVTYKGSALIENDPIVITLANEKEDIDSIYFTGLVKIKIPLVVKDNNPFIESFNIYNAPEIGIDTGLKINELSEVKYAAGRKKALSYEWLRYSAVIFNCEPSADECRQVRWALEIDGIRQLLTGKDYEENQIDLQMKEEWIGKTICVIPYIAGNNINSEIGIKTEVIAD